MREICNKRGQGRNLKVENIYKKGYIQEIFETMGYVMLFDAQLKTLFEENSVIAVVGAKDKPGSPAEHVGRYLIEQGYEVLPVHPVRKTAWGLEAYKSLADLPKAPDIVCLFRASDACYEHALEILQLPWRPKVFWMQLGIVNAQAGELMAKEGVTVVEDACIEVEHKRVFGK